MTAHQPKPTRPLGLFSTAALVVASMVGAGVFTTSGYALAAVGSPAWVLLLWLVGGVVALCGAVSYGALAKVLAESGGEYVFLARRVHPLAGFLAGWTSLVAGFTASMALAATAFEAYLLPLLPGGVPPGYVAATAILLCAVQHAIRVDQGAWLQNAIVLIKLVGFTLLVVAGWYWLLQGEVPPAAVVAPTADWQILGQQLTWISVSYLGFNAAVYVSEEVDNAERNVPRAMLLATLLVMAFYLALNALLVYAGPLEQLAGQEDIAAVALGLLGGPAAEKACRVLVCVALLSSVSALTMAGPRVYAKMASDGLFPLPLSGNGPPRMAIALQAGLALGVIAWATLQQQLNFLGFLLSVSAAATVATLFVSKDADASVRPNAWQLVAAAVFVVCTLTFAGLAAMRQPASSAVAAGVTLAIGAAGYLAMRWWRRAT